VLPLGRDIVAQDGAPAAAGSENLMPYILEAVRAYATLGEMTDALRKSWGEYLPFGAPYEKANAA